MNPSDKKEILIQMKIFRELFMFMFRTSETNFAGQYWELVSISIVGIFKFT